MTHLILVRHGQSEWNLEKKFTGWVDVDLTGQGKLEACKSGEYIKGLKINIDYFYTSFQLRAINTLRLIQDTLRNNKKPIRAWQLNERHYGALQGLNKSETATKYGEEQVQIWRRSYDIDPPSLLDDDERHPKRDLRYKDINNLPTTESLATTLTRVQYCWEEMILPALKDNQNILITAHGNSLRALVKMLDDISEEKITEFNIPTGVPILYHLDDNQKPISREFLGDPKSIEDAIQSVANQANDN